MEIKKMIEVLQAFEEGKEVERLISDHGDAWVTLDSDYIYFNFINQTYRIKPQATREGITAKWVKDNNIVVGSKVKIVKPSDITYIWDADKQSTIGDVCVVKDIEKVAISLIVGAVCGWSYDIESLEPYKEEMTPFSFEDRNEFKFKWVKFKKGNQEFIATAIDKIGISFGSYIVSYQEAFEQLSFIDGTPFGKLA